MTELAAFERLVPALRHQIVNALRWPGLRPVQALSIPPLLDGHNAVILAPTAGGKTEAAFLPLLSAMDAADWAPCSVVYVSPIRALLNNQAPRVELLAGLLGRRAAVWHGDVGQRSRRDFTRDPTDVLLTTPESLEVMLVSPSVPAARVFANLRAVIIDEVHAFAGDDRGGHLMAVLERLSRLARTDVAKSPTHLEVRNPGGGSVTPHALPGQGMGERRPREADAAAERAAAELTNGAAGVPNDLQRVGLSATVGNPERILAWMQGSSTRPASLVDPPRPPARSDIVIDYVGSVTNAATLVERLHPGRKRLVFTDSRRGTEELGRLLRERGLDAWVLHSSLSPAERQGAERAFQERESSVIVSTSALELGLDVGDLDHVLQIDAPSRVASFLQRMGRTGRRPGTTANMTFLATEEDALLLAAGLVGLHRKGFVESVQPPSRAAHLLAHQVMALTLQRNGLPEDELAHWLRGAAPFADLTPADRSSLLAHMRSEDILADADGRMVLGAEGERRYGRMNFRELYAVFSAPPIFSVLYGGDEVGTLDAAFVQRFEGKDLVFTLGGRAWRADHIDWQGARITVQPASDASAPRWFGRPTLLGPELSAEIRAILTSDTVDPSWSQRARERIARIREQYAFLQPAGDQLVQDGVRPTLWTFAGGRRNLLRASHVGSLLGVLVTSDNFALRFPPGAAPAGLSEALATPLPTGPALGELVERAAGRWTISKFEPCLPPELRRAVLLERFI